MRWYQYMKCQSMTMKKRGENANYRRDIYQRISARESVRFKRLQQINIVINFDS